MSDKIYNFYDGAQNVEHIETQIININLPGAPQGNQEDEKDPLINELLPIFMNNRAAAAEFLQDIREAKPTDITKRVKLLVKEGTISEEMSHKDLYDILFKYHYYDRTLQNWNSQL